jgi:hypothetical protein
MAQAEVEIVYKANATSLEASVGKITQTNDELVKGASATSKKVADEFKKIGGAAAAAFGGQQVKAALDQLNRESDKLTKNLKELEKEQVLLIASGNRVSKAYQENAKAQQALKIQINQVNAEQAELNRTFGQTETKQKSLTGQLRALKQELALLEQAGKDNTEEFEKLVIAAAKLEDQIGDTRERVRVLSSDTFKFDAAVGAISGLASGFEAAQGAAALFGSESEELQEAINKTTAATALANGVREIAVLLTGQEATKLGITTLATKLFTVQTVAGTVAISAFKVALAATGIGLFLGAIALVVDRLQSASKAQKDLNASLELLKSAAANSKKALEEIANASKTAEDRLALLTKNKTQLQLDRAAAIKDLEESSKKAANVEIGAQAKAVLALKGLSRELRDSRQRDVNASEKSGIERISNETKELEKQIVDQEKLIAASQTTVAKINRDSRKATLDINKEFDEAEKIERENKEKEAAEKAKAIANKSAQDRLKIVEERIRKEILIDGESQQERIDLANNLADQEKLNAQQTIENATLRAATIARIEQELANNIEAIKLDERKKANEIRVLELEAIQAAGKLEIDQAIELAKAKAEAEKIAAGGETDPAKRAALEAKAEADKEAAIKKIKADAFQADVELFTARLKLQQELGDFSIATQERLIDIEFKGKEAALKASADQTLAGQKKLAQDLLKLEADKQKALLTIKQNAADKEIELDILRIQTLEALGKATLDDQKQLINDELKLKINAIDQELIAEDEKEKKRALARAKANGEIKKLDDESKKKQIDDAIEIADQTVAVINTILDFQKQASENRINDITETKNVEIEAINQTLDTERDKQKQREAAELRASKRINEEKTKQAKRDKAQALFQAGIDLAVSILKTGAQLGYPAAIPFQVVAGIVGAVQIAAIASKPIPKFKKGGIVGGQSHEAGGTMIEAEKGEFVVNRSSVARHRDALDAMNRSSAAFKKYVDERYVRPALMDFAAKNRGANVTVNASLNSKSMEREIKGLRKDLKGKSTVVNINSSDSRYEWHRN